MNTYKYLGATLAENGDLDAEMTHRIQSGWQNWKRVSGILCDRRIRLRVKGKVYKTVVSQCSAQVFKRAGCHLKRHFSAVNGPSKGHFSAVNGPSKGHFSAVNGPSKGHFSAVN